MTPRIDEVAPDLYRIGVYVPQFDLQFNQFLVRDDEPLLFHTGMRGMFPAVREAVAALIPPESLRWISWSHFEVDECGALNEWLAIAPKALPVCGELGAMINIGTSPTGRRVPSSPKRSSRPDATGSASFRRRICPTAGMRACCSRRPIRCCSAPISCTCRSRDDPTLECDGV